MSKKTKQLIREKLASPEMEHFRKEMKRVIKHNNEVTKMNKQTVWVVFDGDKPISVHILKRNAQEQVDAGRHYFMEGVPFCR